MSKGLSRLVILVVALVTIGALYETSTLKFDYEFEHFFPSDDPDLEFYHEFQKKFSNDVDFTLVALKNNHGIFHEEFLKAASDLCLKLEDLPKVERVISPFSSKDFVLGPFGPITIPILHPDDPSRYAMDSTRIYSQDKLVGSLFSTDAKSICVIVMIEEDLSKIETDSLYNGMMEVMNQYKFDELHTAGKAVGQAYYIARIKYEFVFFFIVGVLLILVVLVLVYRSVWGTVVPMLIVLISVVWLLGFLGWVGKPIDIMIILLPLVLFVVGISDVVHLLSRYFEEIRSGKEKIPAIIVAYKKVGMATFLTSLTTAFGFLTLMTSNIQLIKELGIFAAVGVFIAFILAFSLLPAILVLSAVPNLAYKEPSTIFWNLLMRKIFILALRHGKIIVLIACAIAIVSIYGITKISIDNYLMEDMAKGDPHRLSFEYFEEHFAGVRPFEMEVWLKDSTQSWFEAENVKKLQYIEDYLKNEYGEGVNFLNSPLNVIRTANQALHGGKDSAYSIPSDVEELDATLGLVKYFRKRPEFNMLISKNNAEARFSGKIKDIGGKRVKELDENLTNKLISDMELSGVDFKVTGMSKLIDKNNETLSLNIMHGLLYALIVIGIIMGIIFKSFKMIVISLVPNILPLLAVAGFMGFLGIDLKISTSVIFGIAFGIAVDDTIHYLSKFRQEMIMPKPMLYALKRTSLSTGKAIIITTFILCSGFSSLVSSDFTSIFYVGLLISITLLMALLADLFLLPVLLMIFNNKAAAGKW